MNNPDTPQQETSTEQVSTEHVSTEQVSNRPSSQTFAIIFLCQGISFAVMLVLAEVLSEFYIHISFTVILVLQGLLAAFIGYIIGMAIWWIPIHFLLPGMIALAMTLNIPGWVYLATFIALFLVFWNSSDERIPLYLTNKLTWITLSERLSELFNNQQENQIGKFIDLGCGLSGLLLFLAPRQANIKFYGIESAPVPYAFSVVRRFISEQSINLKYGNFWKADLSDYDVVYCFLSPVPMPDLFTKAKLEMKPGSMFISNSFVVPGQFPDETIQVDDRRQTQLFVWYM